MGEWQWFMNFVGNVETLLEVITAKAEQDRRQNTGSLRFAAKSRTDLLKHLKSIIKLPVQNT